MLISNHTTMKRILYITIAIFSILQVNAENTPISEANNAYKKGAYKQAITDYEAVLNTNIESPEIYFNLANAYYKTGQIAPAILNYERAKLLAPADKDIDYNLKIAQAHVLDKLKVVHPIFYRRWIASIRNIFSADMWSYLSIALFIVCLIALGMYLYSNKTALKKVGFFLAFVTLIFCIVTYAFASVKTAELTNREYAIVFSPSVTVKASPDESGTELFVLHSGTKVKILEQLGDWTQIQISDGNEGWLKKSAVEKI